MWRRIITRGKKVGHALYALAATLRYVWWYRQLTIVAVTGTDGKSSTVLLTAHLLRAAGYQVAHYSSISCHDGTVEIGNHAKMTMPGKGQLHQFLAQAAKRGVTHAVVQVTTE